MADKTIEKAVKQFIKRRPFKLVATYDEATAMMVFKRNNLKRFSVSCKDNFHEHFSNNIPEDVEVRYLKSTNPRDKRNATLGYIREMSNTSCKYKIYRK